MRIQALRLQETCAEVRGHELTGRHDPRAGLVTQFPDQGDPGTDLAEFLELALQLHADRDLQFRGQAPVTLLNGGEYFLV